MSRLLVTMQLFLTIALANARNDPPPTAEKPWMPPGLSKYEDELAQRSFSAAESGFNVSINPRKVYNLAELIDIAERTNPETRVAFNADDSDRFRDGFAPLVVDGFSVLEIFQMAWDFFGFQ